MLLHKLQWFWRLPPSSKKLGLFFYLGQLWLLVACFQVGSLKCSPEDDHPPKNVQLVPFSTAQACKTSLERGHRALTEWWPLEEQLFEASSWASSVASLWLTTVWKEQMDCKTTKHTSSRAPLFKAWLSCSPWNAIAWPEALLLSESLNLYLLIL